MPAHTTLFVGLGSSHGDDRAGWLVADALESRLAGHAVVRRALAPLDILNWLEGVERLVICDACQGLTRVGWAVPTETVEQDDAGHSPPYGSVYGKMSGSPASLPPFLRGGVRLVTQSDILRPTAHDSDSQTSQSLATCPLTPGPSPAGGRGEQESCTPGTWRRWRWPVADFPAVRARHSHDLGLPAVLELATRLGRLPGKVFVWGIEIGQTGPEQPASIAIEAAIPGVADDIADFVVCQHA